MAIKREEKALLEFKHIMDDVVHLLQKSTNAETVYLYWVNRSREQFVLETNSTSQPNVMFQDRVNFEQFYLNNYKDIQQPKELTVGVDIDKDELRHYYDSVPIRNLILIPFINNGELVAITVVESADKIQLTEYEETFSAYRDALINVLNTYLELTDLYENQQEWVDYEESMNKIEPKHHKVEILDHLVEEMQKIIPNGGVSVLLRGMDVWTTVFHSSSAVNTPSVGLKVEEKSMVHDALEKGEPQFSIHFNQNPKRVATDEMYTEGATLAIPMIISGRRHGVVLVYDENPLVFKESIKHQLINLVRVATLSIQVNLGKLPIGQDLFTTDYGSFIPEVWEKTLEKEIQRTPIREKHVWFGLITIDNLQSLRSRLRLEDLNRLQKTLVKKLNPSNFGFEGYIGFNSDYVFTYLLFTDEKDHHKEWMKAANGLFKEPVELSDGQKLDVDIRCGYTELKKRDTDVHHVVTKAKKALSEAVKTAV